MNVQVSLTQELYDVSDAIVRTRAIQAFDHAAKAYPIHRVVRCAVRRKLGPVFDDLALQMGCAAQRMDVGTLLLDVSRQSVPGTIFRETVPGPFT